jgi:hypothetical protein
MIKNTSNPAIHKMNPISTNTPSGPSRPTVPSIPKLATYSEPDEIV